MTPASLGKTNKIVPGIGIGALTLPSYTAITDGIGNLNRPTGDHAGIQSKRTNQDY
jgi:hypothetical protein